MKPPLPPVHVPGKTEFERFDNAVRKVLSVSKQELLRREAEAKQVHHKKESDPKSSGRSILSRQGSSLISALYFAKYVIAT